MVAVVGFAVVVVAATSTGRGLVEKVAVAMVEVAIVVCPIAGRAE